MSSKSPAVCLMPDTRLPFMGSLAFNRNTQEYIPFRTETDAMLASLTLAYRLASPILAVVLALVRHPNFNPAEITLSKPEDVWARVAEHTAAKRTHEDPCFPFTFPRVILNEVVDILAEERKVQLHVQRDTDGPYMGRIEFEKTDRDLRNMSLVCKDWTRPAQKALGKIIALQDVRSVHVMNALNSPLFGAWTREAVVFRHNRELDERSRRELLISANEVWSLIARFVTRIPNLQTISLCVDWFEMPLRYFAEGLEYSPLQEIRLVQAGDIAQLLGAVCKKIKNMKVLKHLYLQYSGVGSAYTNFVPPSELEGESPPLSLEKVTLKIGTASELSLAYITWLTRPRDGENGFRLKSLALDLSSCYYNENSCFNALAPCFTTLQELVINGSGLSEGLLARILQTCRGLRTLTLIVRHTFDNSMAMELPNSLETMTINSSFEKPDWELWDERLTYFFVNRAPRRLKHISSHMLSYVDLNNIDNTYPMARAVAKERGISFDFSCEIINSGRILT
ncbi:uncharacterized protein FOMMEDRAFT_143963 [Fomitiporia mediterranea MF3/22]|uniref:uncharacterized protein n=1 Tax=Fomitiporia mediterranea (strain MF3/22) TaxID=694068 RepID=UPI00044079BF|nr:uncharacterized protein FOMMEDRAFT_143963 [Fomitiporia mediterranea MF3/22]EJD07641.1 hypothetical protein FOMMEDRAFT_143963 [Fomitiporia mediterranea MF3/22]